MLTDERIEEIAARHAAATKGPREWDRFHEHCWQDVADLLATVRVLQEQQEILLDSVDTLNDALLQLEGDDADR